MSRARERQDEHEVERNKRLRKCTTQQRDVRLRKCKERDKSRTKEREKKWGNLEQSERREKFLMQRREQGRKKRANEKNERKEEKELRLMQRRERYKRRRGKCDDSESGQKGGKMVVCREQGREFRLSKRREEYKERRGKGKAKMETSEQREKWLKRHTEQYRKQRDNESKEKRELRLRRQRETARRRREKGNVKMIGVEAGSSKEKISEPDEKKVEPDDMRGGGLEQLVGKFHKLVDEGPTYVCICCDQLWYKHSVRGGESLRIVGNEAVLKCLPVGGHCSGKDWVCRTCYYHLKKNKIPHVQLKTA